MSVKRAVLVTCAVIATTVAVRSQSTPSATSGAFPADIAPMSPLPTITLPAGPRPGTAGEAGAQAAPVDLSALRYFASQNDAGRVAAEIRLLRAKHPGWEPPEDLSVGAPGSIDEQPLWDLFAKHDVVGLRARMDEIRREIPDWKPSSDLAGKLALAEAHDALVKASDAKQWNSVIDIAIGTRALLTCGDVDALWRTAEALARTGEEARALEAYRYVIATCPAPGDRLATVQKASIVLPSAEALETLLKMGRRGPDGRGEFDEVRLDRFRRSIGAATADPAGAQPTQAEIDAVTASAETAAGRADAQLLGWYDYARKDYGGAQRWFKRALSASADAKGVEGLVLTLLAAGDMDGARGAATQYEGLKSAEAAEALAWRYYQANNVATAEAWFRKSFDWKSNEGAAVGLVVTARRLHHDRDYRARIAEFSPLFPHIAGLEATMRPRPGSSKTTKVASQGPSAKNRQRVRVAGRRPALQAGGQWDRSADDIVKTFEGGKYDAAVAMLDQRRSKRAEPRGLSLVRGWALYQKGDWESAKQVFSSLPYDPSTRDREEGLRVIQSASTPPHAR